MSSKEKLVRGMGVNDSGRPVTAYAIVSGRKNQLWICPVYQVWSNMLKRCYSGNSLRVRPTYIGCTVAPEWLTFSAFRDWMLGQDWEGKQLDKDILSPGNRVYEDKACAFVSSELNSFTTDSGASRGEWPIGISLDKRSGKFNARCRNPFIGKDEHLGLFVSPDEAHEAWRQRKHELACQYASMQADPRIAQALRTRYAKEFAQ